MSREIKFRAWRDREMVEFELGECLVDRKEKILDFRSIPVMQFTGLKDKNGKEIYEGDVVQNIHYRFSIVFDNGCFCIKSDNEHPMANHLFPIYNSPTRFIEVIGNIYENPELLTH